MENFGLVTDGIDPYAYEVAHVEEGRKSAASEAC